MKNKQRIISLSVMILPSLMLVFSAFLKITRSPSLMEGFAGSGFHDYVVLVGITELVSVLLWWLPRTSSVGFLLLCSYLGGAMSMELHNGHFPAAAVFLAVVWVAEYLRHPSAFKRSAPAPART